MFASPYGAGCPGERDSRGQRRRFVRQSVGRDAPMKGIFMDGDEEEVVDPPVEDQDDGGQPAPAPRLRALVDPSPPIEDSQEPGVVNQQGDQEQTSRETAVTFEAWIGRQPESVQKLVDAHIAGLKNAAQSSRTELKQLQGELKKLRDAAAEGSVLRGEIDKLSDKLTLSDQRAEFYEQAHGHRVRNLKLAWIAITNAEGGLTAYQDRRGDIDFELLEEQFPELFIRQSVPLPPDTRPGAGQGSQTVVKRPADMNRLIRKKVGR